MMVVGTFSWSPVCKVRVWVLWICDVLYGGCKREVYNFVCSINLSSFPWKPILPETFLVSEQQSQESITLDKDSMYARLSGWVVPLFDPGTGDSRSAQNSDLELCGLVCYCCMFRTMAVASEGPIYAAMRKKVYIYNCHHTDFWQLTEALSPTKLVITGGS